MNEMFGVDPGVFKNANELKFFLGYFGPYSGRYLASYPHNWASLVEKSMATLGDIEIERIRSLLRRAQESKTLILRPGWSWREDQNWIVNVIPLVESRVFYEAIALQTIPPAIHHVDERAFTPTTGEHILGTPSEYVRIMKTLLGISSEIMLIDPYLNPCQKDCEAVLLEMFRETAKGGCKKITLWARAERVSSNSEAEGKLKSLARNANLSKGTIIEMFFVEDGRSETKMHARYLLSIKGGISLDQGFQRLPKGRRVAVEPVPKSTHDSLLKIFHEGNHDMRIAGEVKFNI